MKIVIKFTESKKGGAGLSKPVIYKTKQREAILSFIEDNKGNMITAKTIYESFLNLNNPIGMATIYRRLEELTDQGMLSKHNIEGIPGTCYRYKSDKESNGHAHLMCENCGNLTDLDCDFIQNINSHLLKEHRFGLNDRKMIFYGTCRECMGKK